MLQGKRKRRIFWAAAILLGFSCVLWLVFPVWFPWILRPLATREGIMRTRGKWFDYDTGTRVIRAIATFHPAYLLRSPSYKRMSWQDLRAIAKALESATVSR